MRLFTYFRSSAAYRVRIALRLKGLAYTPDFIHLRRNEQSSAGYTALNPQALVPALIDGPTVLSQSMAIIEYLDEIQADPPLLPGDAVQRAHIRSLALAVACDIHPLNNLRVLRYLKDEMSQSQHSVDAWYRHWVAIGLTALEAQVSRSALKGRFCVGDRPTLADVALVPQLYNARRYQCDLVGYPTLIEIEAACLALPAFAEASPEQQPDADADTL